MRIRLNGDVMRDANAAIYRRWGYTDVCCPADIIDALEKCPDGEDLILDINSGGGSVYAGFEMYSVMRDSGRKNIIANIRGIAGSAMSVVVCGAGKVIMSPVGNVMIHRSSTGAYGNEETHTQAAQMLNTIDESILNAYERKTGQKCGRDKLRAMMEDETFLTAQQAVEYGFADEISEHAEPDAAVASMNPTAALFHRLPPIEDLIKLAGGAAEEATAAVEENEGLDDGQENDPGVQNNETTEEQEDKMDEQENTIVTVEQLATAYPDLAEQIRAQAAEAERTRIADIEAQAMPGYESIIDAAKKDPKQTAATVAKAIIAKMKEEAAGRETDAEADAEDSGANSVTAADAPEAESAEASDEAEAEALAKETADLWKKGVK